MIGLAYFMWLDFIAMTEAKKLCLFEVTLGL